MMAGNPSNWWSTILHPPPSHHHHQQEPSSTFLAGSLEHHQHIVGSPPPPPPAPSSSSLLALNYCNLADINQELPHQSWSQLLLGGMSGDGDIRFNETSHLQSKKLENWLEDHQTLNINPSSTSIQIKQEASQLYGHGDDRERFQAAAASSSKPPYNWPQIMPLNNNASPRSCVTSLSSTNNNNLLDFSYAEADTKVIHQTHHSSECNSTGSGGVTKRARVQSSSTQPPLKVRKEKLGDRITALHQLVSPFGKTDTASVLLEAIGYIRFLQGQIEALSSPYLDNSSANIRNQQQNDMNENAEDLRSRGLCLVPISCTQQVGSDNGADYWAAAAALGGGGF